MIWAVYNGYFGNGACCALVEAENEESAREQAVDVFYADDKRAGFSTPNPKWRVEQVVLPYVCELS